MKVEGETKGNDVKPKKALMQTNSDEWFEEVENLSESHSEPRQESSDEWAKETAEVEQEIPTSAMGELKKLNQHMGQIEGKVTKLSNRYDELSQSHQQSNDEQISADELEVQAPVSTPIDASLPENTQRINKFAKMLKTLQSYKTQYNIASSPEEKSTVHTKVMDFTQKWLDAKNVQLEGTLH